MSSYKFSVEVVFLDGSKVADRGVVEVKPNKNGYLGHEVELAASSVCDSCIRGSSVPPQRISLSLEVVASASYPVRELE